MSRYLFTLYNLLYKEGRHFIKLFYIFNKSRKPKNSPVSHINKYE